MSCYTSTCTLECVYMCCRAFEVCVKSLDTAYNPHDIFLCVCGMQIICLTDVWLYCSQHGGIHIP